MTKIDPSRVSLDIAGMRTRHWHVILPEGMVADGIKDAAIWSRVQDRRDTSLLKHDRVYVVGFDGSFAIEARVAEATRDAVVLAGMKILHFPERLTPLFSDNQYKIVWAGEGYAVIRKSDGMQMGGIQPSESLAIAHLKRQYPVPA